jgi:hypothetical protein
MGTTVDCDTILSSLEFFVGDCITPVAELVGYGYPREFVMPLAETYVDDPERAEGMLRNAYTGGRLEHMHGVHDLDMLEALMREVGADASGDPDATAVGRKRRARAYCLAIRRALGAYADPA